MIKMIWQLTLVFYFSLTLTYKQGWRREPDSTHTHPGNGTLKPLFTHPLNILSTAYCWCERT